MARATVANYEIDGANVRIEFDSGGPVGSNHVVSVWRGEPEEDGWGVTRWFYFDEWHEQYARNFANKVVEDAVYRRKSIKGETDWAVVSDWYDDAARDILDYYREAGVMGYRSGDDEEEREYREAKEALEDICEELFDGIRDRVRGSDDVDEDDLEAFAEEKKDEAFAWLVEHGYAEGVAP